MTAYCWIERQAPSSIHVSHSVSNPRVALAASDRPVSTRARLDAAISDINCHHANAEIAVVTGDLTHWGEVDAYLNFRECMQALRVRYVAHVGNHDRPTPDHTCRATAAGRWTHRANPVQREKVPEADIGSHPISGRAAVRIDMHILGR
jgi:hypothetical protein